MKDGTKERVEQETSHWDYLDHLPEEQDGFHLERLMEIHGDIYELYRYANPAAHRFITVYFHEETKEYKVRTKIGLLEFCRMEFITGSFDAFNDLLQKHFGQLLLHMSAFHPESVSSIVREKRIMEWDYGRKLPKNLEGFELFLQPEEPLEITNGSYAIIDYSDFALESNFMINYNIFRDEFFGEARIRQIPDVSYAFDARELNELEQKLEQHLVPRLQEIRSRAESAIHEN